MHGSEEGVSTFGIAGCDAAPAFELQECVFDEVSCLVESLVIFPLFLTVSFGWNLYFHALLSSLSDDCVAVIAPVCQKVFGAQAFNQLSCLGAVCDGSCGDDNPERHTKRVHGKVELAVKPPFVTPMS